MTAAELLKRIRERLEALRREHAAFVAEAQRIDAVFAGRIAELEALLSEQSEAPASE